MLRHASRTSDVVFVEETSLTGLVAHAAKQSWRITCRTLREHVGPITWPTMTKIPHVYRSVTLGVYFDTSTWVIMTTSMGVSCIVDSIADKIRLVAELNIRITRGLEIIQQHVTNRLPMPEVSKS